MIAQLIKYILSAMRRNSGSSRRKSGTMLPRDTNANDTSTSRSLGEMSLVSPETMLRDSERLVK